MSAPYGLRCFVAALLVATCTVNSVSAREDKIDNPKPDRTWGRTVGGLFTSGKSVAVVIGISKYIGEQNGGYPPLLSAVGDADKMVKFLRDDAGFDTIYVLTDEDATKQKIDHLMTDEIPLVVGQFDRFLFYWSGHGDQMVTADKRALGFLPLADSKRGVFSTMVNMEDIARWNRYLSAQQALFVLDACLSGLAGSEEKGVQDSRLEQLSQSSRQLVTAGTDQENVIAGDKWTGSLFTDSFILGAKGAAQHSLGIVSLYSLIDYIQERVAIEKEGANWSKSLTPQVRKLSAGNGAFFFTPKANAPNIMGPLAGTPSQVPESKGMGQPGSTDHPAETGPVARAEQPRDLPATPAQLTSSALLKRLGDANVLFSVERETMLDWLGLPDERYRRIAEASLALLKGERLKHRANLDVVVYRYATSLGLSSDSDLPPQPKIDKAVLQKALLEAYNEENGASAKSLEEIVEKIGP
jgi:hypothetical protein